MHSLQTGIGGQVASGRGEAAAEVLGAPDQGDAAVVRNIEPLVPVGRPGVGAGQASGQVRTRRIRQGPHPERAIDMHPRLVPPGPLQDVGKGSNAPVFTSPAWAQITTGPVTSSG